jgi:hypothetical protein
MENLHLYITSEQQGQYLLQNIVFTDLLEHASNPSLIPLHPQPPRSLSSPPNSPLPEYMNVQDSDSDDNNDDSLEDEHYAANNPNIHTPTPPPSPQPLPPSTTTSNSSSSSQMEQEPEFENNPNTSSSLHSDTSPSSSAALPHTNAFTYTWPSSEESRLNDFGWYRGTSTGDIRRQQVLDLMISRHMTINDAILAVIDEQS